MGKYFAIVAAGLLILFSGFTRQAKKIKRSEPDNKSLLWKISGNDIRKPSYLFGTIHLLCKEDYIWTPAMNGALKKADEVCFEMDMDDPGVLLAVASGMIDMSGKTLKERISPADYQIIEQFVEDSLRMNMSMFQQMKPVALQSLFATKTINCNDPVSYETNIMEIAQRQKKSITGLEEPSEQLALFDNMDEDTVIRDLVDMAKDYSHEKKEYKLMLDAYKKQDLPALYEIIHEAEMEGEDMGQLLNERNKKWIERIEDKMEQKSVFFAVGAGHLWGDYGVIALLRAKGYKVEPLR